MASAQDPRALLQKADKALAGAGSGFSFFGGREEKYQNAADLYVQAANAFKLQNLLVEAGRAFERAADVQTRNLNEPDDAANTLVDAFKAYRRDDPVKASECLEIAVAQYCSKGNFRRAASHKEALGEIFVERGDFKRAMSEFETAAGWYDADNANALASKLWLRIAEIAATAGDYYKSIELFEKVATAAANNNLMRYSVKDYLFKAGIVTLATNDQAVIDRALNKYRDMDPSFASARECALLADLAQCQRSGELDEFTQKLFFFNQVCKLDNWKTDLFVRIKEGIVARGGGEGAPAMGGAGPVDDVDDFA